MSALGPLSLDLNLPALPELAADLGATESMGQLTMSACLIGLAAGQIVVGPWSDRRGRRMPLMLGLLLYTLLSLACAFAPSIEVLIALRAAQGFAGAFGIVLARAIVRDLFDGAEVARTLSLLMLVSSTAPLIAPLLGGQLLKFVDWRGVFVVLALIAVGIVTLVAVSVPESLDRERRHAGGLRSTASGFGRVFADPLFTSCAVLLTLNGAGVFTYISASSFVLQQGYGLTPEQFSFVFAGNSAGIVALGYLNSILVRRFRPDTLLLVSTTIAVVGAAGCVLSAALGLGLWALLIPLFVTVAGASVAAPNGMALALSRQSRDAGTASAVVGTGPFLAGAALAPLALAAGSSAVMMSALILVLMVAAWGAGVFGVRRAVGTGDDIPG